MISVVNHTFDTPPGDLKTCRRQGRPKLVIDNPNILVIVGNLYRPSAYTVH